MATHVALLRGINVGGNKMIPMTELKKLLEAEGFAGVKTLLQSGNVVFQSKTTDGAALEAQLERLIAKKFGHAVEVIVRDKADCEKIIAKNPFLKEAKDDPGHLVILCLKAKPSADALTALKAAIVGREYFKAGERCLYLVYPDGIGTSKLTNAVLDKKLGTSGTARNWNTVLKIAVALS